MFSFIYEAFIAVLTSPSSAPWAFCPFFNYSTYSTSVELLSFPFYLPLVPSSELLEGRDKCDAHISVLNPDTITGSRLHERIEMIVKMSEDEY